MKKALRRKGIVSLLVLFSLSISLRAGEAFAVTQSEIDDIQRQRESLTAQREQSQAKVDELQAEQASVLEQKAALDARSQYACTRPQSPLCGLVFLFRRAEEGRLYRKRTHSVEKSTYRFRRSRAIMSAVKVLWTKGEKQWRRNHSGHCPWPARASPCWKGGDRR